MRRLCQVMLNNERYLANAGDLLLDWALLNGVELPHDCRAGMCGACRVRLVEGKVFGVEEWLLPALTKLLDQAHAVALLRCLRAESDTGKVRKIFDQIFAAGKQSAKILWEAARK